VADTPAGMPRAGQAGLANSASVVPLTRVIVSLAPAGAAAGRAGLRLRSRSACCWPVAMAGAGAPRWGLEVRRLGLGRQPAAGLARVIALAWAARRRQSRSPYVVHRRSEQWVEKALDLSARWVMTVLGPCSTAGPYQRWRARVSWRTGRQDELCCPSPPAKIKLCAGLELADVQGQETDAGPGNRRLCRRTTTFAAGLGPGPEVGHRFRMLRTKGQS